MSIINVFTDGSCYNNGKKNAIAGIGIYFGNNDKRNVSERINGKQTNNTAELTAIIKVFDILKEELTQNNSIIIYSDSEYSINSLTTWAVTWEKNNWKKKNNKQIENIELIKIGYSLLKQYNNVQLSYIRAHTGKKDTISIGNEKADELAYQSLNKHP
jgi:ribonuclease HI